MLKKLRKSNPEEFKIKLKNNYYTLLHIKMLEKKMKPKKTGYREKVKKSEILLSGLKKEYRECSPEKKDLLRKNILLAAEERYNIELEELKYHENQAKNFSVSLEKKCNDFEKNKEKFIDRIVTKLTSLTDKLNEKK